MALGKRDNRLALVLLYLVDAVHLLQLVYILLLKYFCSTAVSSLACVFQQTASQEFAVAEIHRIGSKSQVPFARDRCLVARRFQSFNISCKESHTVIFDSVLGGIAGKLRCVLRLIFTTGETGRRTASQFPISYTATHNRELRFSNLTLDGENCPNRCQLWSYTETFLVFSVRV